MSDKRPFGLPDVDPLDVEKLDDISRVVNQCYALLRSLSEQHGISTSVGICPSMPQMLATTSASTSKIRWESLCKGSPVPVRDAVTYENVTLEEQYTNECWNKGRRGFVSAHWAYDHMLCSHNCYVIDSCRELMEDTGEKVSVLRMLPRFCFPSHVKKNGTRFYTWSWFKVKVRYLWHVWCKVTASPKEQADLLCKRLECSGVSITLEAMVLIRSVLAGDSISSLELFRFCLLFLLVRERDPHNNAFAYRFFQLALETEETDREEEFNDLLSGTGEMQVFTSSDHYPIKIFIQGN